MKRPSNSFVDVSVATSICTSSANATLAAMAAEELVLLIAPALVAWGAKLQELKWQRWRWLSSAIVSVMLGVAVLSCIT